MKPAKQSRDFCVCLEGLTLPMGVIYGNVCQVTYFWNPDTRKLEIFDRYKKKWRFGNPDKFPKIMHYVHEFMRSGDYMHIKVQYCRHEMRRAAELAEVAEREAAKSAIRKERRDREFLRDSGAPQEKRAQYNFTRYAGSCYSQGSVDGKGYRSLDYGENAVVYNEDGNKMWSDRGFKATVKDGEYVVRKNEEREFPVHGDEDRVLLNPSDPNKNFFTVPGKDAEKIVTITKLDNMKTLALHKAELEETRRKNEKLGSYGNTSKAQDAAKKARAAAAGYKRLKSRYETDEFSDTACLIEKVCERA